MQVNFQKNLKQLRVAGNISQKQLAEKLNITVKTVSHWETGYTEPSLSQLLEIASFFEISVDELLK